VVDGEIEPAARGFGHAQRVEHLGLRQPFAEAVIGLRRFQEGSIAGAVRRSFPSASPMMCHARPARTVWGATRLKTSFACSAILGYGFVRECPARPIPASRHRRAPARRPRSLGGLRFPADQQPSLRRPNKAAAEEASASHTRAGVSWSNADRKGSGTGTVQKNMTVATYELLQTWPACILANEDFIIKREEEPCEGSYKPSQGFITMRKMRRGRLTGFQRRVEWLRLLGTVGLRRTMACPYVRHVTTC